MIIKKESVSVNIKYKLVNEQSWVNLAISPQEYFDLEEHEKIEVDSIPIYNHALDYINKNKKEIEITQIAIYDHIKHARIIITETFWDNQNNRIIERIDTGKADEGELIIVESKIRDNPLVYEIIRFNRKDEILIPEYHGFITQNSDGSQTESFRPVC